METSNLALEYLVQGFKLSCQAEGKSPRTVEWYTAFLLRFLKFLQSNSLPTILGYIDKGHIRAFIRYLQTEAEDTEPEVTEPVAEVEAVTEAKRKRSRKREKVAVA